MSDEDRELLLAHDALVCGSCGNLISECHDPDVDWHPHKAVCYVTATLDWGKRRLQKKYEQASEDLDMLDPLDGAYIYPGVSAPEDDEFVLAPSASG